MNASLLGEEIGDLSRGGGSAEAHRRDAHTVQGGWVGLQVLDLRSELPSTAGLSTCAGAGDDLGVARFLSG
jgi:hypothetical protein